MPFTVSHAAAVLPLRRIRRLPWVALVLGSFGPDFEYFLRFTHKSRAWHYFPDILLYCLPFTLLCFYLFHAVIKRPMARLLPRSVQQRIWFDEHPYPTTPGQIGLVIATLLMGLATHVTWDALTHPYTWPWQHIVALRETYWGKQPGYALAQTASSVGGLVAMIWFTRASYQKAPVHEVKRVWPGWVRAGIVSALIVGASLVSWWHTRAAMPTANPWKSELFQYEFVIGLMACWMWGVLAVGVVGTAGEKLSRS